VFGALLGAHSKLLASAQQHSSLTVLYAGVVSAGADGLDNGAVMLQLDC
jgi:hypothetical protein